LLGFNPSQTARTLKLLSTLSRQGLKRDEGGESAHIMLF